MMQTDKIPEAEDAFEFENLEAVVLSTDGKRADKIKITVNKTEDTDNVSE